MVRLMADDDTLSRKRRRRSWLIAGTALGLTVLGVTLLSGPSPPRKIVMATGQPGGMYDRHGEAYAARLGRIGLEVELRPTAGSVDNLKRLLSEDVDVAFVQGGTYPLVEDSGNKIRGIAALYYEPLWVFHGGGPGLRSLGELAGRRISIGLSGSGTEAVATALLRAHGMPVNTPNVERLPNPVARERLAQGRLQAAFFVTSYGDPVIAELLNQPEIRLLSFDRGPAYSRTFPALTPLALREGTLDLKRNLPPQDVTLLAPAALLACRTRLHPRVVDELLKVAQAIHGPGTLLDPPLRFPSREGLDIPLHEAADIYLTHGQSFLSRNLPYALLRWTLPARVLVISLLVWFPLARFLPEVGRWRIDRRFSRLYSSLRDADRRLGAARDAAELKMALAELDRVCAEAEPLCQKIPPGRQRHLYDWRIHVEFVRSQAHARLAAMEGAPPAS
jgi:TRAP transporter TAXI family solute receptor